MSFFKSERQKLEEDARREQWRQNGIQVENDRKVYQSRLRDHQATFKCAACGKPSNGPVHYSEMDYDNPPWGDQWDEPTGLIKCEDCGNYFCKDHIEEVEFPYHSYKWLCRSCIRERRRTQRY